MKNIITGVVIVIFFSGTLLCQRVTVTSPWSGQNWFLGAAYAIRWNIDPPPAPGTTVDIYLFQSGRWVKDIARGYGTGASGDFNWTIPPDTPPGASQVQVVVLGSGISGISNTFTINRLAASHAATASLPWMIQVHSPNGGESFPPPTMRTRWEYNSRGSTAARTFRVYLDQYHFKSGRWTTNDIRLVDTVTASSSFTRDQTITITGPGPGKYKLRVESSSPTRIWDQSDDYFDIL